MRIDAADKQSERSWAAREETRSFVWMVGWPWSNASSGVDGHPKEDVDDMDSGNSATQPHVSKDVLAAGRAACYKVCPNCVFHFFASVRPEFWWEGRICSHPFLCQFWGLLVFPLALGGVRSLELTEIYGQHVDRLLIAERVA